MVEMGYLKALPQDPGGGEDSWQNFVLTQDAGSFMRCKVHGAYGFEAKQSDSSYWSDSAERGPGDPERISLGGPVTAEVLGLSEESTHATYDEIIRQAKADFPATRRAVALALRRLGSPRSVPVLREMLRDEDEYVRKQAAWSLGKVGTIADVEHLLPLLMDPTERVRDFAAFALARLGDFHGEDQSLLVLRDVSRPPIRRGEAARALGDGGHMKALPLIEGYLADPDTPPEFRERLESARRLLEPKPGV